MIFRVLSKKKGKKMNKKYLKKNDDELIKMKCKLLLDIKKYLINEGIIEDNIFVDYNWRNDYWSTCDSILTIDTDENCSNIAILEGLEELNLESILIDSGSDKTTTISLK